MKLQETHEKARSFLHIAGYSNPRLEAIDVIGEIWSCIYRTESPKAMVEVLIEENRIVGFRKLKNHEA